ncbi:MAG TPA: prephenate dehydrogenase/arogenate dehydrogenase family protein [Chloroflexi bacterium]|nr:prephenate dehydrogenase/arogenate dehydrogenase family protein [Chloroflexota bacterium]
MGFEKFAIIGADCISTSIALNLKERKDPPHIVGYDKEALAADLVRSMGAFDDIELKVDRTCRDADFVLVAAPLSSIRDIFSAIAPALKPGCFVTDTARLKRPVMRWAQELLPDNVYFAGGHIVLNPVLVGLNAEMGLDLASADLLTEALYCVTVPYETPRGLIDVFADLIKSFDAQPFFIDAAEHDGLQSGIDGLPDLLAIALLRSTIDAPGWEEMRKFADHRFASATEAAVDVDQRQTDMLLNRENIVQRLNALISELLELRDLLDRNDDEALEQCLAQSMRGRSRWLRERAQGMWVGEHSADVESVPPLGQQIKQIFFGDRTSRAEKRAEQRAEKKDR